MLSAAPPATNCYRRAWALLAAVTILGQNALAQSSPPSVADRLASADSAFAAGAHDAAERAYLAVLEAEPWNSRATYRLAELRKENHDEALRLFTRYVELEPSDPWGYIAVAEVHNRAGQHHAALQWYARAVALAPAERDAAVGRARVLARAGRTDAAVASYEAWVSANPSDAEAWRELSGQRQRAGRAPEAAEALERAIESAPTERDQRRLRYLRGLSAPAFTPLSGASTDSDGNLSRTVGASLDVGVAGRARLGGSVSRNWISDVAASGHVDEVRVYITGRPRATVRLEAALGVAITTSDTVTTIATPPRPGRPGVGLPTTAADASNTIPTFRFRARWRAPGNGSAIDVRFTREPLQASPRLVANRIVSEDTRALVEAPVAGPLRVRALGRLTALRNDVGVNWRRGASAVLVLVPTNGVEISGQFHHASFASPTTDGYFAPRLIQTVEAGSYMELYPRWANLVAIDVGVGLQRTAEHLALATGWEPAARLWSSLAIPIGPGSELVVEIEGYRAQIGDVVAASAAGWSYGSASLSMRLAFP